MFQDSFAILAFGNSSTAYRENKKPNSSVHFRIPFPYRQGFLFDNPKIFRKFSRNLVTKMSKTPVYLFSEYPKILKIYPKISQISKIPVYKFINGRPVVIQKYVKHRPSTLRGREKQLFVLLTIFCV